MYLLVVSSTPTVVEPESLTIIQLCISNEILSIVQSQCQNSSGELGDVGDGDRLTCLHGEVDTTISCMCTCTVGSAQCSG